MQKKKRKSWKDKLTAAYDIDRAFYNLSRNQRSSIRFGQLDSCLALLSRTHQSRQPVTCSKIVDESCYESTYCGKKKN